MSDRDKLLSICEGLGLKRVEGGRDWPDLEPGEYSVAGDSVLLGSGDGYCGFFARFDFYGAGKVIRHGVWE